jgi:hypothetical protein
MSATLGPNPVSSLQTPGETNGERCRRDSESCGAGRTEDGVDRDDQEEAGEPEAGQRPTRLSTCRPGQHHEQ